MKTLEKRETVQERVDVGRLTQWQLIRLRFARHKAAQFALRFLACFYFVAIFAEFFANHPPGRMSEDYAFCPPQVPKFSFENGLHIDLLKLYEDPITLQKRYMETDRIVPLGIFAKSDSPPLWGFIPLNRTLLGVDEREFHEENPDYSGPSAEFHLLGADKYGRDVFSRLVHGSRISLSIGLCAIAMVLFLGIVIGGISGYFGGVVDLLIQRFIEIVQSFPNLPLWIAIGAALPAHWTSLQIYFGITVVLSLLGWTGLARVVRGKILSLREEEYATAARLIGAGHSRIMFKHLVPGFTSHIVVVLTLSVPEMILAETALSFLGLGLKPPVVSWGVMLQDATQLQILANYPWLLLPVFMVVGTVLCFNFLGDGLRDAADPYEQG